ncbi:hypothetical protein [Frankia tisae]|uniref:hypothetical protein n=1 Tax=Frankia tisae TaxID=2950104 RepID=UPI0021BF8858|nr:hypothetical protein [Frankia tisae]
MRLDEHGRWVSDDGAYLWDEAAQTWQPSSAMPAASSDGDTARAQTADTADAVSPGGEARTGGLSRAATAGPAAHPGPGGGSEPDGQPGGGGGAAAPARSAAFGPPAVVRHEIRPGTSRPGGSVAADPPAGVDPPAVRGLIGDAGPAGGAGPAVGANPAGRLGTGGGGDPAAGAGAATGELASYGGTGQFGRWASAGTAPGADARDQSAPLRGTAPTMATGVTLAGTGGAGTGGAGTGGAGTGGAGTAGPAGAVPGGQDDVDSTGEIRRVSATAGGSAPPARAAGVADWEDDFDDGSDRYDEPSRGRWPSLGRGLGDGPESGWAPSGPRGSASAVDGPARVGGTAGRVGGLLRQARERPPLLIAAIVVLVCVGLGVAGFLALGGGGSDGGSAVGAAAAGKGHYAKAVREAYLGSCLDVSNGNEGYCTCTLDKLEATYTEEEYKRFSASVQSESSRRIVREMYAACRDKR